MNFNPLELLKNAQELQKRMAEAQGRLGDIRVKGSAGGGMVEVELNGRFEAQAVRIAPQALVQADDGSGTDLPLLSDLVLMALRDAHAKAQESIARELGGANGLGGAGGLGGLFGNQDSPGSA
jgi:nucleoid-associated protein EbfC